MLVKHGNERNYQTKLNDIPQKDIKDIQPQKEFKQELENKNEQ